MYKKGFKQFFTKKNASFLPTTNQACDLIAEANKLMSS